jgi:hypothetical protein
MIRVLFKIPKMRLLSQRNARSVEMSTLMFPQVADALVLQDLVASLWGADWRLELLERGARTGDAEVRTAGWRRGLGRTGWRRGLGRAGFMLRERAASG